MAPIKSIVETALQNDPSRDVRLYFGVRDEQDVYLEDELKALWRKHPKLQIEIVLSRPVRLTSRRVGMVADAVIADTPSFNGFKVYTAGPPPMVEALQQQLQGKGMKRSDIHVDAFYSQDGNV
jgi:naphthalene 1,2-dioxygenase ferredoxin reductase component